MKRWITAISEFAENEKVDAFLAEVIEVSKRHGFSISHEDDHGSFIVCKFSQSSADWLLDATDDTSSGSK